MRQDGIIRECPILFVKNDGGRAAAGYQGTTGDCVTRAIAIATGLPYQRVYDDLHAKMRKGESPRKGVPRRIYEPYLKSLGWVWVPTMKIGTGCKVHLRACELPDRPIVCRLSGHLAAVVNRVLHDTHDCSRDGTRCVYGYFMKPDPKTAPANGKARS
jgi:hypothetical protein